MITAVGLFESPEQNPFDFCSWGWMKCEERNVDTGVRISLLHF